ncbi:MAG: serine hydrolase [Bacteroidales bacterium]
MKKIVITILAFSLGFAFVLKGQLKTTGSWTYEDLDDFIVQLMTDSHIPGLSACIILGDSVVWNNNYGYMNLADSTPVHDSTLFNVFSIGKAITAASIMQLWDQQVLGLDKNINDFLPFQIINPNNNADSISPRMLMCHSSSIKAENNVWGPVTIGDPEESLESFLENYLCSGGTYYSPANFLYNMPGTFYSYSYYGSALNGYLVEPLTGIGFKQYAKDSLFVPLNMSSSAWFLDDLNMDNLATGYGYSGNSYLHYGHPAYPGISLRSTALELANFLIMLMNNGMFGGNTILSGSAVDSMTTVQISNSGLGLSRGTGLYGDRITWGHNGGSTGGYAAHMHFCKVENSGVVITMNLEQFSPPLVMKLFDFAARIVIPLETTEITETGFTLNWDSAYAAVTYHLDIATDSLFRNFLDGYENLDIGLTNSYEIGDLTQGTAYYCRLRSFDGEEPGPNSSTIYVSTLFVGMEEPAYALQSLQCFPNPVSDLLRIRYDLITSGNINISIYNHLGQKVGNLDEGMNPAGMHQTTMDLSHLPSGLYFLRTSTIDNRQSTIQSEVVKVIKH